MLVMYTATARSQSCFKTRCTVTIAIVVLPIVLFVAASMPQKPPTVPLSYPPLGTLINRNTLKLVEVLRVGRNSVVYRAVESSCGSERLFAVKCRHSARDGSPAQRRLHLQQLRYHYMASIHPSVITLHRVVEEFAYTFIIMDFAPDGDLFTQILHTRRYLGNDALIKQIFLQLLDAVRYCHVLQIYHQDIQPKHILCSERGYKVAISGFGLATSDQTSAERRLGSTYHNPVLFSPAHNDIWSLAIILVTLVTGRTPWKSVSLDDPAYRAYVKQPSRFFLSVLPISEQFNDILVHVLHIGHIPQLSLSQLRASIQNIQSFYRDDVAFEGSLALFPWGTQSHLGFTASPFAASKPLTTTPVNCSPDKSKIVLYRKPKRYSIDKIYPNRRHARIWSEELIDPGSRIEVTPTDVQDKENQIFPSPEGKADPRLSDRSVATTVLSICNAQQDFTLNPGWRKVISRQGRRSLDITQGNLSYLVRRRRRMINGSIPSASTNSTWQKRTTVSDDSESPPAKF